MSVSKKDARNLIIFCGNCGYTSGKIYRGFPKWIKCPECKRRVYDLTYIDWDSTPLSERDIQDLNEILL